MTEHRRLLAIRYLGGILELPTFWKRRIENDPHSLSDGICGINIQLLEYVDSNSKLEAGAVLYSHLDTLRLDLDGVHMVIRETLHRLPLSLLPGDDIRSENSLEISDRLMRQLQRYYHYIGICEWQLLISCFQQQYIQNDFPRGLQASDNA